MTPQSELDARLATLFRSEEASSERPDDDKLLNYHADRLTSAEREEVAEHLSTCEESSRFILAAKAFSEPVEELPFADPTDVAADFRAVQRRLRIEQGNDANNESAPVVDVVGTSLPPSADTKVSRGPWWTHPTFGWGLAATLLFVMVGLQMARGGDAARLAELEAWKAESNQWTSNVRVLSVESWGSTRGSSEMPQVRSGDVLLLDLGEAHVGGAAFLEVLNADGGVEHRVTDLMGLEEGIVRLLLPRDALLPGDYVLWLVSGAGERVQEYRLQVLGDDP